MIQNLPRNMLNAFTVVTKPFKEWKILAKHGDCCHVLTN
jgi:hypothetical protein